MERITSRKKFNKVILDATYKAQEKYGFKIGIGEHATWNNEADAFKHAYMSWLLSYKYGGDSVSEQLGNMHEDETPNSPPGERNMDLWNNAMGREIAYDMKRELGEDYDLLGDDWASDYASGEIYKKMQNGELIYVENYERSDGTKVHGYYRRRPYFSSKKSSK